AMYTPGLSDALQISPISLGHWLILLVTASVLFVVDELHKRYWRTKHHPKVAAAIASQRQE
ncbi:cation transporting ATPase C-terminal domain-containing protein, partial [Shewanella sp. 0m-11]